MKDQRTTEHRPDRAGILEAIRRRRSRGLSLGQLVATLADGASEERTVIRRRARKLLKELEREGAVLLGKGKRFFVPEFSDLCVGRIRIQRQAPAVVETAGEGAQAIEVPRSRLHGAMDGDLVAVRLERGRRRGGRERPPEGTVVRVVERRTRQVVGRWVVGAGRPHIRPVERKVRLPVYLTGSTVDREPRPGELVVATLDAFPDPGGRALGTLVEVIGLPGEPGVEERVILRLREIPVDFPAAVLAEVGSLSGATPVDPESEESGPRWDLRDRPAITIDGASARDFDDAVNAYAAPGGAIVVEVHIADVGHFVRPGTAVDESARERGTSVYLPGLCVPMLPPALSEDLCSLREGVDRLTYTVRFRVRDDGELEGWEAAPSIIRSRRRCTYDEVFGWLELGGGRWPRETRPFAESLELLSEAADRLSRSRRARGSLDFDLADAELRLDAEGRVVEVERIVRNRAHRLIEELMVAANECVARLLMVADQPALYRVHEAPDPAKVEQLSGLLAELGLALDADDGTVAPAELQRVLADIRGTPHERLLSDLVLRTLSRACYSPEPRGHYALATASYLHFTSPIRRYPDLVVHRMLRRLRRDGAPLAGAERATASGELESLAVSCSELERRAEDAERQVVHWKKVLFLRERVGETFGGHITGVTGFGLFVQLDDILVEGLVHISELVDDHYRFDESQHVLLGERHQRRWRLGDPIELRLMKVDLDAMRLDFAPLGLTPERRPPHRESRRKPRRRS